MNKISPILQTLALLPLQGQAFPRQTTRYVQVAIRAFHHTPSQRNTAQSQPHLLPEFSLEDKVIVVSGGARGLGLVQIEALLEAGATVHAVDRLPSPVEDPKSNFSQVSDRGRELGTSLHYHQVDIRDVPGLNRIFEDMANGAGRLDGLIAASAAVVQLARNLAMEWGEHGIRVNTFSPGYILTQMLQNLFNDYPDRRKKWPEENLLGRLSTPEEYRGAAVFLLSDASSFMTGADLRMDGGQAVW
ncbi:D-arabinitol 2-dehydrogenase [Fusarium acutatum]|uniref:D-arabinitol 2-dehydrogenase n=1 Tax=Fusarium acutatum TaxID=78861 RepID=A0A8H4NX58_9HYPO|nr:D-arabinitol 2-dehydrogenase [Fusarium acutatum]